MTKLFSLLLISGLLFLSPIGKVFADTSCQPVYGGGQSCVTTGKVTVSKTVQNPQTGQFVDNLTSNESFAPNQNVTFHISITNTGSSVISQIIVKDTLPEIVTFVSGPGSFDTNTRTLTFLEFNLNPNETKSETIQTKSVEASQLPVGDMVTCRANQASITATDTSSGHDSSSFCVQKQVTTKGGLPVFPPSKVMTTPATGPELIPLIGLLPAGLSGWFLRKKSGGKK